MHEQPWRKCSNCKNPIPFASAYWVCNVSTCNRQRTGLVFCSVDCWDAHLPIARHKDAWCEERRSPEPGSDSHEESPAKPKRLEMRRPSGGAAASASPAGQGATATKLDPPPEPEILVVASKVKAYIRARSGLNTSAGVLERLSDRVRSICDEAIRSALRNERKTVLDRDL